MNTDIMRRYVALKEQVDQKQGELKPLTEEMEALETKILDELLAAEIDSIVVSGVTLYRYVQRWANRGPDITPEQAIKALKRGGLGELVTDHFNASTLSAWWRERVDANEKIPLPIRRAFVLRETPKLGARRKSE